MRSTTFAGAKAPVSRFDAERAGPRVALVRRRRGQSVVGIRERRARKAAADKVERDAVVEEYLAGRGAVRVEGNCQLVRVRSHGHGAAAQGAAASERPCHPSGRAAQFPRSAPSPALAGPASRA